MGTIIRPKISKIYSLYSMTAFAQSIFFCQMIFAVPMTPKIPTAQGGNGKIVVQWRYDGGGTVDGFRIKRSTRNGGPYTAVGTTAKTPYSDNTVSNGTKYYYVVCAYVGSSESAPSPEVWAVPRSTYSISVSCSSGKGTLPRYERYHTAIHPMNSAAIADLMKAIDIEYVRNMAPPSQWAAHPDRAYNATISVWGAKAVMGFYRPSNKADVYNALKSLKTKYPDFVHVEVDNEPELVQVVGNGYITVADYMKSYRAVVEGIAMFHADAAFANTPRMKIGGPCVAHCQPGKYIWSAGPAYPTGQDYMFAVLDSIYNAELPLDFVSWHSYGEPVADLKRQAEDVKAKLAQLQRDSAEIIITEWSGEKGGGGTLTPTADQLVEPVSYFAAGFYQWMEAGVQMPMTWAILNSDNHLKSQMVPGADGKVYPLYNLSSAYHKMKTMRIEAISDGLASDGTGPGAIAAFDAGGVTVFCWNHKSPNTQTSVLITINSLPFTSGTINLKQYRIDNTTSNYKANSANDKLQLVSNQDRAGSSKISIALSMKAHSLYLLELAPAGGPVTTFPLTVNNGSGDGSYAAEQSVSISANAPASGQAFDKWTGAIVADSSDPTTTIVMPAAATTVTATYKSITTFVLTVNNGTGGGNYQAGQTVAIAAQAAPYGEIFDRWTGAIVANALSSATTLVMPSQMTTVSATYRTVGTIDTAKYQIMHTAVSPVIDGAMESLWSSTPATACTKLIVGSSAQQGDFSPSFRALWNAAGLYLFAAVIDDKLQDDNGFNSFAADNVELYLDCDNSKGTSYDANDLQYRFVWNNAAVIESKHDADSGVVFAQSRTANGYQMEISIPWKHLGITPARGTITGFDVQITDNDSLGRETKLAWHDVADSAWRRPVYFGEAILLSSVTPILEKNAGANTFFQRHITIVKGALSYRLPIDASGGMIDIYNANGKRVAAANSLEADRITLDRRASGIIIVRTNGLTPRACKIFLP